MTNKLPKIGVRYKHKDAPNIIVKVDAIGDGRIYFKDYASIAAINFFTRYEEIPEEPLEKEVVICKVHGNKTPHYSTEYKNDGKENIIVLCDLCLKGQPLVESNIQEEAEKFKNEVRRALLDGLNDAKVNQSESIWKPVSELPNNFLEQVLVRFKNSRNNRVRFAEYRKDKGFMTLEGGIIRDLPEIEEYCALTDFINQQDLMIQDIKELWGIVNSIKINL